MHWSGKGFVLLQRCHLGMHKLAVLFGTAYSASVIKLVRPIFEKNII
jgi:hypothetical protein